MFFYTPSETENFSNPEGIVTTCVKSLKKCTSFALATPLIGICAEEVNGHMLKPLIM